MFASNGSKIAIACLAVVLAIGAGFGYSRRSNDPGSGSSKIHQQKVDIPKKGVAFIDGQLYVNGTPTPVDKSPDPKPTGSPSPIPNFVKATIDESAMVCPGPRPGTPCRVPFQGTAYLATAPEGVIRLAAFENGESTPTAFKDLEPKAKPGRNNFCYQMVCRYADAWLDYIPSEDYKKVRLVVLLLGPNRETLAEGFALGFETR